MIPHRRLESGPGGWSQDQEVRVREMRPESGQKARISASRPEPRPRGWSQGLAAGIRARRLESGPGI